MMTMNNDENYIERVLNLVGCTLLYIGSSLRESQRG